MARYNAVTSESGNDPAWFFIIGQHVWVLISGAASTALIALMFVIEYAVRCRRIPSSERSSMGAGIRAYFADRC